jgi:hypothetical protein
MISKKLPPIQGRRFDIETLQYDVLSLVRQTENGPTWLGHDGKISYVVMTEELFSEIWPDSRRVWGTDEMPDRMLDLLESRLQEMLDGISEENLHAEIDFRTVRASGTRENSED